VNEENADNEPGDSPLHGYQGQREHKSADAVYVPAAPSIAISREVGARGSDIARRLGTRIGWTVYDNELLGYSSLDSSAVDSVLSELPTSARTWMERRLQFLVERGVLADDPVVQRVSRLILALGAKGEAIFVGRGAGFLLPRASTLHVRLTAPTADRIAYMAQSLRMTREEAGHFVRDREAKRVEFLERYFRLPSDGIIYDMVLNTATIGADLSAELIVAALESKRKPAPTT
jgi:cytidylate kinase